MIPAENMRSLDTGTLVTLKQRIERELMRRGDVEQDVTGTRPRLPDPVQVAKELMGHIAEEAKREGIKLDETELAIELHRRMREAGDNSELKRQLDQMREGLLTAVENPDAYMEEFGAAMAQAAGVTEFTMDEVEAAIAKDMAEEARLHILPEAQAIIDALPTTQAPIAQRRFLREPDGGCSKCMGLGVVRKYDGAQWRNALCPCLWGGE